MNIYLINEDGEVFCIKAKIMSDAISICEQKYLEGRKGDEPHCAVDEEKKFYHEQILQSCSLVGELRN